MAKKQVSTDKNQPPQTKPQHGGKRQGAGNLAKDGAKPDTVFQLRLESRQKEKLLLLGGAVWIRAQIDKATPQ